MTERARNLLLCHLDAVIRSGTRDPIEVVVEVSIRIAKKLGHRPDPDLVAIEQAIETDIQSVRELAAARIEREELRRAAARPPA